MVSRLYAGGQGGTLDPDGAPTGIFKSPLDAPVRVSVQGLHGDWHADPRVHGGPDKAVHLYPADHYRALVDAYPGGAPSLRPGSLGENLSVGGIAEDEACIGDVVRLGSTLLQVSQPRSPCWKINRRFDIDGLSLHMARRRITGWYYRVLEEGVIAPGDPMVFVERPPGAVTIDRFWRVQLAEQPSIDALRGLAAAPGLAADWRRRLAGRADWLAERDRAQGIRR